MQSPPPARTLPLGVGILAVLLGLVGVLLLVASLLLFALSGLAFFHPFAFFGVTLLGAILLLIFGIVLLVVAVGLWRLEMWALVLALVVLLILLVERLVAGPILSFGTVVLALLLVYLVAVRRHFV